MVCHQKSQLKPHIRTCVHHGAHPALYGRLHGVIANNDVCVHERQATPLIGQCLEVLLFPDMTCKYCKYCKH